MFERFLLTLPVMAGKFFLFAFIVAVIGFAAFYIGQLLPRQNFDYRVFPYTPFPWEENGKFYQKLRIQRWKDKLPDMSQYIKSAFRKKISVFRSAEYIEELILETCSAEFVHDMLILISPAFLVLMGGAEGVVCMFLYIIGNIPFIMIQRYNRPRLVTLMDCQQRAEAKKRLAERKTIK